MKFIICDIDNCISDDYHRLHLIQDHPSGIRWARYHMYHKACIQDKADFIKEMQYPRSFQIHFISGMPEEYRAIRLKWFMKHGRKPGENLLHLRPTFNDYRPAVEFKRAVMIDLLTRLFNPEDVHACYDDRREIVQMYNDLGLPGVHRAIHDEEFLYHATGK